MSRSAHLSRSIPQLLVHNGKHFVTINPRQSAERSLQDASGQIFDRRKVVSQDRVRRQLESPTDVEGFVSKEPYQGIWVCCDGRSADIDDLVAVVTNERDVLHQINLFRRFDGEKVTIRKHRLE